MSNSGSQNRAFGTPVRDLSVNSLYSDNIVARVVSALEVTDGNLAMIENDIFELQELVGANAEDLVSNAEDIADLENNVLDLQFMHILPWFVKSNFVYGSSIGNYDSDAIDTGVSTLFTRHVSTTSTFYSALLFLPHDSMLTARHAGVTPETDTAAVYVTTNPLEATRLTGFNVEFFGSTSTMLYQTLLGNSSNFGRLFGTRLMPPGGNCVVLTTAESGFTLEQIYLDNSSSTTSIVMVFQKFRATMAATLPDFTFYGIQ
jgi:hypothetical protein